MSNLKLVKSVDVKAKKSSKADATDVKVKMTPVERMAAARAASKAGGGKAAASKKKAKPLTFKSPADFKPAFFEVDFATGKDALIKGDSVTINRVKGKWDNADAPRYNLSEYDTGTLLGVVARLGTIFAPNILKRLPISTKFGVILRVNKKAADGTLSVVIKGVKMLVESKKNPGKFKWKWFDDKADVTYRKIRKIVRILPSAFVSVQLPPSGKKKKAE